MGFYVSEFQNFDKTNIALVGGKGANLGELSKIQGLQVPAGFCISTAAFKRILTEAPSVNELLDQLSQLKAEDRNRIAQVSSEIRRVIEEVSIPADMQEEISIFLSRFGESNAYAIRSSATAEDLPTVSFAGQQDTYLNIIGKASILEQISKCWASLFTERAVTYRLQNGFDHRKVQLSVIVQQMVFPQTSGILFTADPISGHREVLSIDASFGLGEALVSGLVNADSYKVRDGKIMDRKISSKKLAISARKEGGIKEHTLPLAQQNQQALTNKQILQLAHIGKKIEAHFGCPQDIEWCLADGTFSIVQSRPITTLYPIPEAKDQENHIYVSVGHQQMMTDPLKPLGLSLFLLTTYAPMHEAGGRLFVDIMPHLASPANREILLNALGESDPLIKDALLTIIERGDLVDSLSEDQKKVGSDKDKKMLSSMGNPIPMERDPCIVSALIKNCQISIEELRKNIQGKSGSDLFDFILEDLQRLKALLFDPQSLEVIIAAQDACSWINKHMALWLDEKNPADTLSQSLANNITSAMGLALLDVADAIRPYPEVIRYLQQTTEDNFLDELPKFAGGKEAKEAISAYLRKYGMRCAGEIDITNTRWSEKPAALIPMILNNIKNFAENASQQKFEQGLQEALEKEQELLHRLHQLPGGKEKAEQTKQMIRLIRNFMGYREYPKYGMISRYFIYKEALMKEAEQLIQAGVLQEKEDVCYLTFQEFHQVVATHQPDGQLISKRKDEYKWHEKLTPPRVITSHGEIITGRYKRQDLPAGALAGLAVSSGVVEGRARVILTMEDAHLEEGDILVTTFTDPSWTPLFISVKGLITEVGGLMTHGAVIAREYSLPAVIGVENATKLIKDGQQIRVNGTEGYVELLW